MEHGTETQLNSELALLPETARLRTAALHPVRQGLLPVKHTLYSTLVILPV